MECIISMALHTILQYLGVCVSKSHSSNNWSFWDRMNVIMSLPLYLFHNRIHHHLILSMDVSLSMDFISASFLIRMFQMLSFSHAFPLYCHHVMGSFLLHCRIIGSQYSNPSDEWLLLNFSVTPVNRNVLCDFACLELNWYKSSPFPADVSSNDPLSNQSMIQTFCFIFLDELLRYQTCLWPASLGAEAACVHLSWSVVVASSYHWNLYGVWSWWSSWRQDRSRWSSVHPVSES